MHRIIDGELSVWKDVAMKRCEEDLDISSKRIPFSRISMLIRA